MKFDHVERKAINGELCDVYYDKNGEVDRVHLVRVGRSKWGIRNCPDPKMANFADSAHKNAHGS